MPFWTGPADELLSRLGSGPAGLAAAEAARRLAADGPNRLAPHRRRRGLRLLLAQIASPIIILLIVATVLAMALGDLTDGTIILVIIAASAALGFWQEHSAGTAVDDLLRRVEVRCTVHRDGVATEMPPSQLVTGDILLLRAGDIVPGDCRVLASQQLQVDESALTGESFPAEKDTAEPAPDAPLARRSNALFMGTHVVSGTGTAVLVATARHTEFAAVYARLASRDVTTGFERGLTRFGLLLLRAMAVLVTAILIVNLVLGRPTIDSVLFSLALAVGLTPQLLPAIVAVSLSAGARRMAARHVIVKRLDAIEDLGGMTVLCTDKTGTLTAGAVRLDGAYGVDGHDSDRVLRLARLNAGLQQGPANPIDTAILGTTEPPDPALRLDEVPYDFQRKRLSVLVRDGTVPTLVTNGAFTGVLDACTLARMNGQPVDIDRVRSAVEAQAADLGTRGFRVLGLATRALPGRAESTVDDERTMVFEGLLAFHDPVRDGAADSIRDLAHRSVAVRLVTGDSAPTALKIAGDVGLTGDLMTGAQITRYDDRELAARIADVAVFAEVEPLHKERIVRALRHRGEVVGFLGDGINDAPALHAADIGISVDTAVDVAKESASVVLLSRGLDVVVDGVTLGRQTFANTLKYVRVTISANFGNMLSMAAAAVVLPFLPMLPRQILLLNFLTDIPGTTIATDSVDDEQLRSPRRWDIRGIRRFMVAFGLVSTAFDLATFVVLRWGFHAGPATFRTGWFLASVATELAAMLVLRTGRPFFRSRPSRPLLFSSAGVAVVALTMTYLPVVTGPLGLTRLPGPILAAVAALTAGYVLANEIAKRTLHRLIEEPA